MGILDAFGKSDKKFWFVCYDCMQRTGHDTVKAIFYYTGPPTVLMGRAFTLCPRCQSTNTASFQKLKDEGSEAQLWGLEQTAKQHPRSFFEVKPRPTKTAS